MGAEGEQNGTNLLRCATSCLLTPQDAPWRSGSPRRCAPGHCQGEGRKESSVPSLTGQCVGGSPGSTPQSPLTTHNPHTHTTPPTHSPHTPQTHNPQTHTFSHTPHTPNTTHKHTHSPHTHPPHTPRTPHNPNTHTSTRAQHACKHSMAANPEPWRRGLGVTRVGLQ